MSKIVHLILGISILLIQTACTKLGPDYVAPDKITLPQSWEENLSKSDESIKQWWTLFEDASLNVLVQKSYEQNFDIKTAGLRILQARASLGISEGLLYPQQQSFSATSFVSRSGGNTFAGTGVNFDIGWEMDVWGKYARGIESSEASLYANVASYDDILVSIISEVARNYINYRTTQERIAYAKRNISIQKYVTKITQIQYNSGSVSELDVQQSLTQLYITQSILPSLEFSKVKFINAIAVLLGVLPKEIKDILDKNSKEQDFYKMFSSSKDGITQLREGGANQLAQDTISLIPSVVLDENLKIDASLVRRRPDLQVAELNARVQSARIGSAEAELYPRFTLFGNIGINTNSLTGLSAGDSIGFNAGPAFSWNIFQYGRIKNQIRVQDALFQQSLVNYQKKLISAVAEVSNALNGYKLNKIQKDFNAKSVNASIRAFNLSMIQYNNGLVGYQRLLSTVENLTRNEDKYASIKGNIALQVVALYKALGGGWQIRNGQAYISKEDKKQMRDRTDWGKYLDTDLNGVQDEKESDE